VPGVGAADAKANSAKAMIRTFLACMVRMGGFVVFKRPGSESATNVTVGDGMRLLRQEVTHSPVL